MLRISLFGVLRLEVDGVVVAAPSSRRARMLLAMLALDRRAHSREALAAQLWPDVLDESARTSLRTALAQLRAALGPAAARFLVVSRERVALAGPEEVWTDVGELERLLERGHFDAALKLWDEGLVTGLQDDWIHERREQLRDRVAEALARGAAEAEGGGDLQSALRLTRRLASLDSLAEEPQCQLIRRLAASGDRGAALLVYEKFAERLRTELRTVPSAATLELVGAIRAGGAATHPRDGRAAAQANGAHAPAEPASGELPTGVVTFLLTDIEGSTRLWETSPNVMAAALELHDELIADAVESHRGRLLKQQGEGDGTLTVFLRASDAVACAADLQAALTAASWPGGLDLRVRIALHTGEAHEREGDYFGPALNRAARLRAWARGGATVVSQATTEIVRDGLPNGVQLIDLGAHELRDIARPERVYALRLHAGEEKPTLEPVRVRLAVPGPLRFPAEHPFVGRDTELAHLRELWAQASADARPAVFVAGEAGIGKTRLAAELAGELQRDGALVLYGRCDEGLAVPYQPFVEALRPYTTAIGPDRIRAELGPLAPHLGRLLPELPALGEPARGDAESERFALFDAVSALLAAATREQRALLILDDLHWAASPTLLLLRHVLRTERPVGMLLLGTYRDTELNSTDALQQLLADLQRDACAVKVSIGGLDDQAIAALLDAMAGTPLDERTSELVRLIRFQTGGNTFFIREFLAHLCESGAIDHTGQPRADDLRAAELWVPEGLRDVIRHRVARLSTPARRALDVAAVAGQSFSLVVLERVLGETAAMLDALDEAAAAGLLTETGPGAYAFTHALVRQALYGALSATRRMRLHRQVGEALETLDDRGSHIEALAHHFAQSAADGQSAKAATYALAAGRSATARLGYEDAAAHYERGLHVLELSGQPQEQRRCELLLALGEARWEAGEIETARQAYRQAAELAEARGDATALAHAALGHCGHHAAAAEITRLVTDLLQRALAALSDDDSALRARLMGRLAAYADFEHRQPALARQALQMARRVADKPTLADVLASALWAVRGPDALDESLAMTRELGRVADEIGDRRLRAFAHWWLLDHLLELGDIDAVQRELEALQRLVRTRRERAYTWVLAVVRANEAFLRGRLDDCERRAQDGLALARRVGVSDAFAAQIFAIQMFFVRREQGRLDERELVKTVEGFAAQSPQISSWRCALVTIYARLERTADARHALDALARADFADLRRDANWLASLSALTEAVVLLNDVPRARLLYDLLLPYADRCVVTASLLCQGSVSHPLGLLATTLSRYQDAARHFEHALTMNAQIRSPLLIAHTQHHYARMLLARNGPDARDKAVELLDQALATAEEFGLEALADKSRPLKLAADAPGAQAALPRSR